MKALLHTAPFRLEYTEVEDPQPGPDDLLVRVEAVGICGSDVHGYTGKSGRRIPPVIMGHEAAGVVEAIGVNVTRFHVGDRVCFDSTVYCNACEACREGRFNHCTRREVLGVSVPQFRRNGAMADRLVVPWWIAARMPEDLTFVQAALLEPVSIGVHAVNRAGVKEGETVVIIGAGTIGLCAIQAARLHNPGWIVAADLDDRRLEVAQSMGADVLVNASRQDLAEEVRALTGGRGADVAIEAVGFSKTVREAVRAVRTGGRVTLVGNLDRTLDVDLQDLVSREITLIGSYASSGEYRQSMELVATGQIDVAPLVSEVLPLSRGQEAFERLHEGEERLVKIVLTP